MKLHRTTVTRVLVVVGVLAIAKYSRVLAKTKFCRDCRSFN
jgi:hypothetical protein